MAGEGVGDGDEGIELEEDLYGIGQTGGVSLGMERSTQLGAEQKEKKQGQEEDLRDAAKSCERRVLHLVSVAGGWAEGM